MASKILEQIKLNLHSLNASKDLNVLLDSVGKNTRVVMIGEASHGTREFYEIRAELTKRLIKEKGFNFIGVEGDFPECYRVNEYVHNSSKDKNANEALSEFKRFPRWMWRNTVVSDFIEWLKMYNADKNEKKVQCSFMGLDLYSLNSSRAAVLKYLKEIDPEMFQKAKTFYSCFDRFGQGDEQVYAMQTGLKMKKGCRDEVNKILRGILENANKYMSNNGVSKMDKYFYGLQNAIVVKNVENYYSNMYGGGAQTWNIRDEHMYETLKFILEFYSEQYKSDCKIVVWAHNSHLGDASQTEMGEKRKEINIGQLIRQGFPGDQSFNIGFTTYNGYVTAAHNWDSPPNFYRVNKGLDGSYEKLLHHCCEGGTNEKSPLKRFTLVFESKNNDKDKSHECSQELKQYFANPKYERAIGVIYRPNTEFLSHYFKAKLSKQFDAVIHVDRSHALTPLEISPQWEKGEKEHVPDTYPFEY